MYLIFDFDGTLVDSFRCAVETFNFLAPTFRFRKIKLEELNHLKDLSSKALIKHLQIPAYKVPIVIHQARKQIHKKMQGLVPFYHIHAVLKKLYDANISLGILTSNSEKNVTFWLEHHHMKQFFNFIAVESHYFGKKRALKKVLDQYKIDKHQAYYIGDETRDIEAANQSGIYSVAVTWGFNSKKILSEYKPHYMAEKPEDILTLFGLIS